MIPVANKSEWIRANAGIMCPITTMRGYIYRIAPSIYYDFQKDRFKSVSFNMHGDLLSGAITSYEATIEIANSTLKINNVEQYPITPKSDLKKLNNLQFYLEYGYESIGYITDLRFFIADSQINTERETVIFTVKSVLFFMTSPYNFADNPMQGTAFDIAESALEQARYDSSVPKTALGFQYEIDESLKDCQISLDSQEYSIIEVLQIAANAAGCIIRVNHASKVLIEPRNTDVQDYSISRFVQYSTPQEEVDPPISGCALYCSGGGARIPSGVSGGKYETLTNMSLVYSASSAVSLARLVVNELALNPTVLSVRFRADPRLELFDVVQFQNGSDVRKAVVTDLSLSFNGAWLGDVKSRDNGSDAIDAGQQKIDVYNTMMEYIAAKMNGKGNYQQYTESFETLVKYLGSVEAPITTIDGEELQTNDNRPIYYQKEW